MYDTSFRISTEKWKGEKKEYPGSGFGESGESETVIGVDRELRVNEEEDGLLHRIQSGDWFPIEASWFHFH